MNLESSDRRRTALEGVLIGAAVGDALGLPRGWRVEILGVD